MSRQLASLSTKEANIRDSRHGKGWGEDHNLIWRSIFHHAAGFNQGKDHLLPGLCNPRGRSYYLLFNIGTPPGTPGIGYIGNVTRSHAVDRPAGSSRRSQGISECGYPCATDIVAVIWGILHSGIWLTTGICWPAAEKGSPASAK